MVSIETLILTVILSYSQTTFIAGSDIDDYVEWRPNKKTVSPFSPEFSWLYLHHGSRKTDLAKLTISAEGFYSSSSFKFDEYLMNQTSFYLYTKNSRDIPQKLLIDDLESLENSYWNPSKQTRIIIHGYDTDYNDEYIQRMKDEFLNLIEENNVIVFDWGILAKQYYPSAVSVTDKVGAICAMLIDFLCTHGGQTDRFHLIGHSLGAHVAGFAGKFTKSGLVSRVTGLDPAYPGFITEDKDGRLDASDAEFVDCIHTCSGLVAFEKAICQADFYPNGGSNPQPGCTGFFESAGCSHSRSHDLFTESIIEGHRFPALTCGNIPEDGSVQCVKQGALMGFPADSKFKGIFYAVTNSKFPFAPLTPKRRMKTIWS